MRTVFMWFVHFKKSIALLFLPWLISILIQFGGRVYLLFHYVTFEMMSQNLDDVYKLAETGLRFDIRSATICYGVLLFLSLAVSFSGVIFNRWCRYLPYLLTFSTLLFLLITIVNIYYYKTYGRYIDVFIFGLIDDDTKAILLTLMNDYPVIPVLIFLFIIAILLVILYQSWRKYVTSITYKVRPFFIAAPFIIFILATVVIGARGSVRTFPLRESDVQISRYEVFNMFVPNGVMALQWAYKHYQLSHSFVKFDDKVSAQLIHTFFAEDKPLSTDIFMSKTRQNTRVEQVPPHIIFPVMESMGTHLFSFDSPENDLLGELRQHIQDDWFFTRFISEGDGTIDSLNRFFVRSPVSKISQSAEQFVKFDSNMFTPFLEKGYKIVFITSGNGAWRNLNQFLSRLGVTEFVEQSTLTYLYPEAPTYTWGVPDEYIFKYAKQRLEQAEQKGEHLFIMLLSVTNHPPYAIPDNSTYVQYQLSADQKTRLQNFGSEQEVMGMLNTFHYANQQLGEFISWLKQHSIKDKTIVAFTGDHNMRGIGYLDAAERALSHAVPLYLYVPKVYQNNTFYDPTRVGSHKDIMPTLYHLALSDAHIYQTGCNLLAEDEDPVWCGVGYNPSTTIDKYGAYLLEEKVFMPWKEKNTLLLGETIEMTEPLQSIMERWQSYTDLLQWQINQQVN